MTLQAPTMDVLWTPHPDNRPQQAAYICTAVELLYGGAAGGGKSDLLLGLAATKHQVSIIFRRMFPQLEALVSRSREIIPEPKNGANFNAGKMIWYKIPGKRKLEFGAAQYNMDVQKYQGRPHDLVAFDELTHFTEFQYKYLTGWLRTEDPLQRTRIIGASNPPPTAEGYWVKMRWAAWVDKKHPDPAAPGELRWYITDVNGNDVEVDGPRIQTYDLLDGKITLEEANEQAPPLMIDGEWIYPVSRTFIPAGVRDNPYYSHDPTYLAQLQALPEPLRSQLLRGDWEAGAEDDAYQVIPSEWIYAAVDRWTKATMQALDPGRLIVLGCDVARGGKDDGVIAPLYEKLYVGALVKRPGAELPDGHAYINFMLPYMLDKPQVNIDVGGVGASAYDIAKQTFKGANIRPVDFGGKSEAMDKSATLMMRNARAEMYWNLRDLLDPSDDPILCLPDDPELIADLAAHRYKPVGGRVTIEDKEKIRKRIGRSPDAGDAVALALFRYGQHDMMGWLTEEGYGAQAKEEV